MKFRYSIKPYTLRFNKPAGTSRGIFTKHKIWYVFLYPMDINLLDFTNNIPRFGIGECAPLPGLSCDDLPENEYLAILNKALFSLCQTGIINYEELSPYPSILFGVETALLSYQENTVLLYHTRFSDGMQGIQINGLIWMENYQSMMKQISSKLKEGFRCIKLKIGSIDFNDELKLINNIRSQFPSDQLTIRVDANGAFSPDEVFNKLNYLAKYDIHSIEQPIKAGNFEMMAYIIKKSPIPVALDEELIGYNNINEKENLLNALRPNYIILKPTLHGGFKGCEDWIKVALKYNIGWWVTSALESNIGLNAIAQWYATLQNKLKDDELIPQGLGTGGLYKNNIQMPLVLKSDILSFDSSLIHICHKGLYNLLLKAVYNKKHYSSITIEGQKYSFEDLKQNQPPFALKNSFGLDIYTFLLKWIDDSPYIDIKTSGSTGIPKYIRAEKFRMINSAITTCQFLKLEEGMKSLLCLPLSSIAGMMMIIRAIVCKLDIYFVAPSGNPLSEFKSDKFSNFDFAAMTPMQVFNTIKEDKKYNGKLSKRVKFENIKKIIIGGAPIDNELRKIMQNFSNEIYSTYGMTETLSHIAMQRVNGETASSFYTPLQSVSVTNSSDGCLEIDAPLVCADIVKTNDLAEIISDGSFKILGRKDHVINTGGLKVQIEELESKLATSIHTPFAITFIDDVKFSNAIVLLIESIETKKELDLSTCKLSFHEKPKHILYISSLPITESGKIDRLRCRELAYQHLLPANKMKIN